MPYDYLNELKAVKEYYSSDPLQKRFSLLLTGETNAGKTYILRTCRFPIHIDSFDPGGTKSLRDLIRSESNPKGQIIADTQWEADDPFKPDKFAKWKKAMDLRFEIDYFNHFGTYCLDSATTWGDAVMNYGMAAAGRAGTVPMRNKDYNPQKVEMVNYIKKLMKLPCDFILTGHLDREEELIYVDPKTGVERKNIKYRFMTTGKALITIPLEFDEIYVLKADGSPPKRELLIDSAGMFVARSRLKAKGLLGETEPPDIKAILKKCNFSSDDKPKLES
jgi:hypothetical protein